MSFSVAAYIEGMYKSSEIIKNADHAMYCAKQGGRNRVEVYDESNAIS